MIPQCGVDHLALEGVHALEVGVRRDVQGAAGQHPVLTNQLGAIGQIQRPKGRLVIKMGIGDFRIETGEIAQAMLVGDALDIVVDLLLAAVAVAPVRIALEREGIHVRLDVTGRARVAVMVPGATHATAFLQQHEIINTRFAQFDGHTHAAEATTDDGDFHMAVLQIDLGLTCHYSSPPAIRVIGMTTLYPCHPLVNTC